MIKLEHDQKEITTRAMDILTPVGFGQLAQLLVARAAAIGQKRSSCKTSRAASRRIIRM